MNQILMFCICIFTSLPEIPTLQFSFDVFCLFYFSHLTIRILPQNKNPVVRFILVSYFSAPAVTAVFPSVLPCAFIVAASQNFKSNAANVLCVFRRRCSDTYDLSPQKKSSSCQVPLG